MRMLLRVIPLLFVIPVAPLRAQAPLASAPPGVLVLQSAPTRTRLWEGAAIGFVAGAAATAIITRSGGSTAPCDRGANQDALSPAECAGLAVAGGIVGGVVGGLIGSRIRVSVSRNSYLLLLRLGAPHGAARS